MTRIVEPDWTSEQIIAVRKMLRANMSMDEAMKTLDTKMSVKSFRNRCLRLGMRFDNKPGIHRGLSSIKKGEDHAP